MLRCIRVSITKFYTFYLDSEEDNDMPLFDLHGDELAQAMVDRMIEEGDDSFLMPDGDIDVEPQDITIEEEYFV